MSKLSNAQLIASRALKSGIRRVKRTRHIFVRCCKLALQIMIPSLPRALMAKRTIDETVQKLVDGGPHPDDVKLEEHLGQLERAERHHIVGTLLTLHEADHARIRGLESKSFATLQLMGFILAGNLAALALVLSTGSVEDIYTVYFSALSGLYLTLALAAALIVTRPGIRYTLNAEHVVPVETSARLLLQYTRRNRVESLNRSNLTQSAIADAARSYAMVILALVFAIT